MKAKVDAAICVGTGLCANICPAVFQVVNGVSTVKVVKIPAPAEEACREAAESCPTRAISIEP